MCNEPNDVSLFMDNITDDYNSSGLPQRPVYYLNITNIMPIKFAQVLNGYIMPFLLVITIIANTLILVVLSKRHMRTPTNIVLMAMALADMFTLLIPSPWLFYAYTFGNHAEPLYPLAACYTFKLMHEVLPNLFHTASIWLTLALAVQRYIYVCHPAMARTWCTVTGINKAIFWIFLFATVHQSTQPFVSQYSSHQIIWNGQSVHVCKEEFSPWLCFVTPNVYFNLYYWFRVICVHVLPCVILVILNVLLFAAMKRAQKKRQRLFKDKKKKNECRKLRDSNMTTLMLIVVVTVFLCVEIPLGVVTILHIINNSMFEVLNYDIAQALILFTNFFIIVSYPINFAIYCGMSRQFRETFQELFLNGPTALQRNGSSKYTIVNTHPPGPHASMQETNL